MKRLVICAVAALLAGCAADTSQIKAVAVSPAEYEDFSCKQIEQEARRLSLLAKDIGVRVDKTASDDDAQTAIGLILFWPALFFLEGEETADTQEFARLKGEFIALQKAAVQKECDIDFEQHFPAGTGQMHKANQTEEGRVAK